MRLKNSIKNIYISIFTQIIITLLGFVSRRIFIDSLGIEYLGVNGLLTNVLAMLSLVEGGIGASIVYNLYKPLAEDDKPKIIALVQLYKKIYSILAVTIFILSIAMYPFIELLIKEDDEISYLAIVYFIFVIKNVISYLNAHKWSLINADQKGYVLARYNLIFNVATTIAKIIILKLTKSYILFLVIELIIFILQNICNGIIVNKRYSYIKTKEKYIVDKDIEVDLKKNVKAMFLHNIGGYCVFGTDNILITAFVNLKAVGLYSNYTIIINQLKALLNPLIDGIGASVGNLIVTESKEKIYEVFNIVYFVNFWIYGLCSILLYNFIEPFINLVFGIGLLLDRLTLVVVLINFYLTGLRSSIITFKTKGGIFTNDKYIPLIEAIINLGVSVILVRYLGLAGIFIGTTISTLLLPFWIQPILVYKNIFNKSSKVYFLKYLKYVVITIMIGILTVVVNSKIIIANQFIELCIKGIATLIIANSSFIILLFRTSEFKYIYELIKHTIKELKIKILRKKEVIQ